MSKAIALIDANNFYASCEQLINPSLRNKPVVILSNNDGCIISRNAEARILNIKMGEPYFKISQKLKSLGVNVFSSNYQLYGDISQRLMYLLKDNCEEIEVYSIDEAFVQVCRPCKYQLRSWAYNLRASIYRNLGLSIAIGIGANKVQAKLANHIAKTIEAHAGIFDIEIEKNQDNCLEAVSIENVWGIGSKSSHWFRSKGIKNARQLRDMEPNNLSSKCGINGIRIQNELKGKTCFILKTAAITKKENCVSRTLKRPITKREELIQLISSYVAKASEKLRNQNQLAQSITIFARTSLYSSAFYSQKATLTLEIASNNTNVLIKAALSLIYKIYNPNYQLIKAGVIMHNLQSNNYIQQNINSLTHQKEQQKQEKLMQVIDRINIRYGRNTITWSVCNINESNYIRCEKLSNAATTRYQEIPIVKASF